jgi:hypothetical protein|tara:strand:+ start:2070 stop:2372 length:303 start_codon:yes stop_codon:yes gene_type:complete
MAGNKNSGRKSKEQEQLLVEKLAQLEPQSFLALKKGIEAGEFRFIQLYFHYRYGKPREIKEIIIDNDKPIFEIPQVVWTNPKTNKEEQLQQPIAIYKSNI